MKLYPVTAPRPRAPSRPIPVFHAVPARSRRDGWTPRRQAEFIGHLAETRNVAKAAQRVGMARETVYRLRKRRWSESFCAAWDAAMGARSHTDVTLPRKVTVEELHWRSETGLWQVSLARGRYCGVWQKADNSALLHLISRLSPGLRTSPAHGEAD